MSVKYTFVSTDGKCDIVTVSKDLLQNCTLTAEGFEQVFFTEARTSTTYIEAYEKAEAWHEETFNKRRYSDYDSFRKVRDRKK
jgi:hypothetical protein